MRRRSSVRTLAPPAHALADAPIAPPSIGAGRSTSLGAKRVCEQALQCSRQHPIRSVVVSDRSALSACERFLEDHRILVEPACGASLAMVYENAPELHAFDTL